MEKFGTISWKQKQIAVSPRIWDGIIFRRILWNAGMLHEELGKGPGIYDFRPLMSSIEQKFSPYKRLRTKNSTINTIDS